MLYFHRKTINYYKSICKTAGKLGAARTGCCSPPVPDHSPDATFTHISAPANHLVLQKPISRDHAFFDFSESHWRLHFTYIFTIPWTCYIGCDHPSLTKSSWIQFCLIFPMYFYCFELMWIDIASAKLPMHHQTCLNMTCLKAFMSPKWHCV